MILPNPPSGKVAKLINLSSAKRTQRALSGACIAFFFALNAWFTWLRLGDMIVDSGRELDTARQICEGRILYLDLRYYYGPLAPWVNAAIFYITGFNDVSLRVAGLVCALITCALLYRLSRCFFSRFGATCVVILFQFTCGFAHTVHDGIFNFVMPYTQAATYGTMTGLASVLFLIRYARKEKAPDLWWAAAFLFLTSLSKLEIFLALLCTHAVFIAGKIFARRLKTGLLAKSYGLFSALFVVTFAVIVHQVGASTFFGDNMFIPLLSSNYRGFCLWVMGFYDLSASLRDLGYSVMAMTGGALLLALAGSTAPRRWLLTLVLGLAAFLLYFLISIEYPFRVLPFLICILLGKLIFAALRARALRDALIPEAILLTFALVLTSRLGLNCVSYRFGFFLLLPSLVVVGLMLFRKIPRGKPSASTNFVAACLIAGLAGAHFKVTAQVINTRTCEIRTACGHEYIVDRAAGIPEGACYRETIRLLSTLPPETPVLVIPQGVSLVYYAGLKNPYGSTGFLPAEITGDYDDDRLLTRLSANPPTVIVRQKSDIGDLKLGDEKYLTRTSRWILSNYEPCLSLGPDLFIVFLKKKGAAFPFPSLPLAQRNFGE